MDFVHRAALSIIDPIHEVDGGGNQVLALGEPVQAELTIGSTTDWSSESVFNSSQPDAKGEGETFIYDIHADSESWLIGGPRRGHLTACSGSNSKFSVTLIPLKLGSLALPMVDVQHTSASSGSSGEEKEVEVRCETHCASAGRMVTVIKDQRKTRVFIPEAGEHVRRASEGGKGGSGGGSRPGTGETVRETG